MRCAQKTLPWQALCTGHFREKFESRPDRLEDFQKVAKPCKSYDLQGFMFLGQSYNLI